MGEPETPLGALRWHWGEAYAISHLGVAWVAQRRDNRVTLHADSPEELRDAILKDYTAHPVGRTGKPE